MEPAPKPERLCTLPWFNGVYMRIYDVLSAEGMLPNPCDIQVLPAEASEAVEKLTEGATVKGSNMVWFKKQPPDPVVFAHELIHLIEDKDKELEEVYAYNLSPLAVLLAERGITPPANPVRLFNATPSMILEALNKAYNYSFKDLAEYFELIGVTPPFMEAGGGYGEREVAVDAVSELIAGAGRSEPMLNAVLALLEALRERAGGGADVKHLNADGER